MASGTQDNHLSWVSPLPHHVFQFVVMNGEAVGFIHYPHLCRPWNSESTGGAGPPWLPFSISSLLSFSASWNFQDKSHIFHSFLLQVTFWQLVPTPTHPTLFLLKLVIFWHQGRQSFWDHAIADVSLSGLSSTVTQPHISMATQLQRTTVPNSTTPDVSNTAESMLSWTKQVL